MKNFKAICFLLLFLGLMSSATSSRNFKWTKNDVALQELHFQDAINKRNHKEIVELTTRRMDFESNDYEGTGANNHHDPRSPGRS